MLISTCPPVATGRRSSQSLCSRRFPRCPDFVSFLLARSSHAKLCSEVAIATQEELRSSPLPSYMVVVGKHVKFLPVVV